MGLFSKTKTYVETSTMSLIDSAPDTIVQTVLNATIKDRSIADDLHTNSVSGLGVDAKSYYRYGRDHFTYGLPESNLQHPSASASTVALVLGYELGYTVSMVYSIYSTADPSYFIREFLTNTRGWDSVTNVISNPKTPSDTPTYFQSCEFDGDNIVVYYTADVVGGTDSEVVTGFGYVNQDDYYYHTAYQDAETLGTVKYWYYAPSTEVYPTLYVDRIDLGSPYFPIVPLRRSKKDLTEDTDTELYRTSKKLLSKFKIKIKDLAEGLNANPDIADVDSAYVIIGCHLQSDNEFSKSYLHDHFFEYHQLAKVTKEDYLRWESLPAERGFKSPPPINVFTIQETENSSGVKGIYHTEIGFLYSEREVKLGNIGEHESGDRVYKRGQATTNTFITPRTEAGKYAFETSYMVFRKQITRESYSELKVYGLKHVNYVYGGHHIDTTLEDSLSLDNDDFIIPLSTRVLSGFTVLNQTNIMYDSIRVCVNAVVRLKLKWYQTSFFKVFAIIVAIVITIYTFGTDGGASFSAAAALGSAGAIITSLVIQFAVGLILGPVFRLIVDVVGIKVAFILAIIATVYGLSGGTSFLAQNGLMLQSGIMSGIGANIADQYTTMYNEYESFKQEMLEAQSELEDLLDAFPTGILDPMTLLNSSVSLMLGNESPESYIHNRIHSGNIGTLAFEEAAVYVENKLKLEGTTTRGGLQI